MSIGIISLLPAMELILRGHQVTIISSNQEKKKDIEA
jgi:hypothetical protein